MREFRDDAFEARGILGKRLSCEGETTEGLQLGEEVEEIGGEVHVVRPGEEEGRQVGEVAEETTTGRWGCYGFKEKC